jgi:hypothetical protein
MTDNTENLTRQILELCHDINSLQTDMCDGFDRVDVRLDSIEQILASLLDVSASNSARILGNFLRRFARRIEVGARFEVADCIQNTSRWRVSVVDETTFETMRKKFTGGNQTHETHKTHTEGTICSGSRGVLSKLRGTWSCKINHEQTNGS